MKISTDDWCLSPTSDWPVNEDNWWAICPRTDTPVTDHRLTVQYWLITTDHRATAPPLLSRPGLVKPLYSRAVWSSVVSRGVEWSALVSLRTGVYVQANKHRGGSGLTEWEKGTSKHLRYWYAGTYHHYHEICLHSGGRGLALCSAWTQRNEYSLAFINGFT